MRMNLGFNLFEFLWSNTLHVGCRSHSRGKERTISSASRFFVKLQYIIWLAPSLIRSQYLYPRWDVWPHANASIRKHYPGNVGSGLCIRCLSIAVCLSFLYMHALHNGQTLAASTSESLVFLECSRCHLMYGSDICPHTLCMCEKLSTSRTSVNMYGTYTWLCQRWVANDTLRCSI